MPPVVLTKSSAVISDLVLKSVGPSTLAGTGRVELHLELPLPQGGLRPPSAILGNYEIVRKLAYGGMAELALAKKRGIEGFEKLVVLKRILPQYAENPKYIQMFLDEARLQATLEHPNIVQVHDIGLDQGSYFFAMEYVRGQDLRRLLKAAQRTGLPLPVEHAIHIVTGTAAALHYAHEKRDAQGRPLGIVHRDVSPSNVLVTYDGAIKLVDFGIAKARSRHSQSRVGALMGKAAYMAPEQCRGETLDRRTDVFALGTLLYELTCGRRPFQGRTDFTILHQIATQDPEPPSSIHPGYPAELEPIVMKALRRSPQERYATAQELQVALEEFARNQKLVLSSVAMAQTMRLLFVKEQGAATESARPQTSTEKLGTAEAPARDSSSQADTLVMKALALRLVRAAAESPPQELEATAPATLAEPKERARPPAATGVVVKERGPVPALRPRWTRRFAGVALAIALVGGVWAGAGESSTRVRVEAPPPGPFVLEENRETSSEVRFTALPTPLRDKLARRSVPRDGQPLPFLPREGHSAPRPHADEIVRAAPPARKRPAKTPHHAMALAQARAAWDPDSALPPRSR